MGEPPPRLILRELVQRDALVGVGTASVRSCRSAMDVVGIASTRTPIASSTADATTAGTGSVPDSPTPLRPSGFSGDGVSRWSISPI